MNKLKPIVLRRSDPTPEEISKIKRNPIYFVLDRVTDTYNIGSLFRLADAVGAEKIYICGDTEYPPSSRIHKAAVGTEAWVPWEKLDTALEAVQLLKERNVQILTVEQSQKSISYKNLDKTNVQFPVAIVVGHETDGVGKDVQELSDLIVELPMTGINHSFNVWGSAAVVAYKILEVL